MKVFKTQLLTAATCALLLIAFTIVPVQEVHAAKDPCRRATRLALNLATKLTKMANLMVNKVYSIYDRKAANNFLSRSESKKLDDINGKLSTLNQTINRVEGDCGQSLTNWCPWTCYSEEWMWPLPPQCQGCWFQWDENVPNMCSWTMNQSMKGIYADQAKYQKSKDKILAKQAKVEEKTKKGVRKKCSKGAKNEAKLNALIAECSVTANWNRPPNTPFGEACWPSS